MVPVQSITSHLTGWFVLAALLLGPGSVACVLCVPLLAAARLRSLFRALPPRDGVALPYVVATFGASVPYLAGTVWAIRTADGAEIGNALLAVVVPLSLGYVLAVPILAGVALPRAGVDWDPTGYGVGTWALLVAAGAWYAAVFAVPLFVVAVILALPT